MEKMDPTLEEASRVSGASPLRVLWDVTLPLMAPSILAGGLLVFIGAGSAFGIPAIVGMPGNIEVLTTRIVSFVYMGNDSGILQCDNPCRIAYDSCQWSALFHDLVHGTQGLYDHWRKKHPASLGGIGKMERSCYFSCSTSMLFIAVILPLGIHCHYKLHGEHVQRP